MIIERKWEDWIFINKSSGGIVPQNNTTLWSFWSRFCIPPGKTNYENLSGSKALTQFTFVYRFHTQQSLNLNYPLAVFTSKSNEKWNTGVRDFFNYSTQHQAESKKEKVKLLSACWLRLRPPFTQRRRKNSVCLRLVEEDIITLKVVVTSNDLQ